MTYTIFVAEPFSPSLDQSKLIKNSANQLIAFDGNSTAAQIRQAAIALSNHCGVVSVFRGSLIRGKFVSEWINGVESKSFEFRRCSRVECSYCNG